jgi:succinate dehydrogenase / fumarate reductase, cytochrome b subunit
MGVLCEFYRSTVGKKVAMALSGLVLVGFVVGHMAGNLKIFLGRDALGVYKIDHYGEVLRTIGSDFFGHAGFLWIVRVLLVACLIVHVVSAISLARINRRAKPTVNARISYGSSTAASRTMLFGGLFLLSFIVYHILHFTTGTLHFDGFVEGKIYANVWLAFQSPFIAAIYIIAMAFLALHLYHGVWSMFQTLGADLPSWNGGLRALAKVLAVVTFLGFACVPASIALGLLQPPVSYSTSSSAIGPVANGPVAIGH